MDQCLIEAGEKADELNLIMQDRTEHSRCVRIVKRRAAGSPLPLPQRGADETGAGVAKKSRGRGLFRGNVSGVKFSGE
jgi:hypothetical protein